MTEQDLVTCFECQNDEAIIHKQFFLRKWISKHVFTINHSIIDPLLFALIF